jgi:release factor glutamine methyltransferase
MDVHSSVVSIPAGCTIGEILKKSPLISLETRILLGHSLNLSRVQLITQSERCVTACEAKELSDLFQRRLDGEPIAYIVGEREFYGLSFCVTPDVLIPRPETELLVELALERLPKNGSVLDMGTGSGAIAVAIAHHRPDVRVTALDYSAAALVIAARNVAQHGVSVALLYSDWYGALASQQFDVIVTNPPYIVAADRHLEEGDLRFEPVFALTDNGDGLTDLRLIIAGAAQYLVQNGWLMMEHGYDQAPAVRKLLLQQQFGSVQSWRDLAGIERASAAQKPMPVT